ncbi:MAG: Hsp20/alpha crystallin family protein [Sedimentisphaerales bacterium]|jgi:HSP20 family protein
MALPSLRRPRYRGMRRPSDLFYPFETSMSRLFDDFWSSPLREMERWSDGYLPPVDIREDDGHVIAEAELPGMSEKEIDVTVSHDTLRISGEKKRHEETKEENYYCLESSYGSFDRTVDLPAEVDENKTEAQFSNGVLTVTMAKSQEAKSKSKKIPVKNA